MMRYLLSHSIEFLTHVITGRTSLKIFLAKNFPSLFSLKTREGEILRWDGVKFETPELDGYFTKELAEILGEKWYSFGDCDVKKGDIVIDAGAHFGFFSYYALKKGAEKVFAFEPNPYVFRILRKHVKLWKAENVILPIRKALYNKSAEMELFIESSKVGGVATLLKERDRTVLNKFKYDEVVKVDATTIDEFVESNKIERVDFIKLDVEGSEKEVLEGAKETIRKFKPKLAISAYHRFATVIDELTGREKQILLEHLELMDYVGKIRKDYKTFVKFKPDEDMYCVVLMW